MTLLLWLLTQSFFVSQVVDYLKRAPFVAAHPKLVSAVLNVAGVALAELTVGVPMEVAGFLAALIAAFSGSITLK